MERMDRAVNGLDSGFDHRFYSRTIRDVSADDVLFRVRKHVFSADEYAGTAYCFLPCALRVGQHCFGRYGLRSLVQ